MKAIEDDSQIDWRWWHKTLILADLLWHWNKDRPFVCWVTTQQAPNWPKNHTQNTRIAPYYGRAKQFKQITKKKNSLHAAVLWPSQRIKSFFIGCMCECGSPLHFSVTSVTFLCRFSKVFSSSSFFFCARSKLNFFARLFIYYLHYVLLCHYQYLSGSMIRWALIRFLPPFFFVCARITKKNSIQLWRISM